MLNQITNSYLSEDYEPVGEVLQPNSARNYFRRLLSTDNIIYLSNGGGELVAWMEIWFLSEEQTKFVVKDKKEEFCPLEENVVNGDVCYVADLFIAKKFRSQPNIIIDL